MDNFTFCSPTEFVFGRDTENQTGALVKKYGGSRVLLVYGGGSAVKSGLIKRITDSLESEKLNYSILGGAQPNPKSGLVREGIEMGRELKADFILAVGGGSVIDTAKAIAIGIPFHGDFWDLYQKKAPVTEAVPVGTVLTIAAAGSEGSPNSVITNEENGLKRGLKSELMRPRFSVMDPQLTETLPAWQTASGITDMMAHILERYFTTTPDVEITDRLCEGLLMGIMNEAPRVIENPHDYQARANLMWAGMLAHNNTCGVGRTQDWASHHLEHELSGMYDVTHGAGLAVIFPAWMEYTAGIDPTRMALLAWRVFGVDENLSDEKAAFEGIARFRAFLKSIGMPLNFEELGCRKGDIPELVEKLGLTGKSEGVYIPLDAEACTAIYEIAADTK
ncbi:MAG: iron-containing alcohol dehydrogenase [Eubacteriaceae bacterium]|jgi:alcohol dehydrogenase YqhD (iron-dependent ADH family)